MSRIMEEQLNFAAWANGNKWGDFAGSIYSCDLSPVIGTQSGIY